MRAALRFLVALSMMLAAPAWADPAPGTWVAYPNSALRPTMAADPTPWNGSQKYIFDYSGGGFGVKRGELFVWGGGHGDYSGNEVCWFTPGTLWSCTKRSVAPFALANPGPSETLDVLADGTPGSRHTSSCIASVDLPGYDGFFCHGGSLWQGGYPVNGTWFWHRDTGKWENLGPRPLWGDSDYGATTLYTWAVFDQARGQVLVRTRNRCLSFTFATKMWTSQGACPYSESELTAAFDPERQIFITLGSGLVEAWNTATSPWTPMPVSLVGDQTPRTAKAPGFVFDPVGKRYLAYTGGQDVYEINRDTWAVTKLPASGADPGPAYPVGTHGRFQYVPATNGLLVVNSVDSNVFYYQLGAPPAAGIPLDTWVAIRNATNLTGPGLVSALYEKHMTAAYSPKTKRLYFNGGDTRKHFVGPGGVDFGGASYYQGTHSLDLGNRLANIGNPNAGWATEHAYCVSAPTEVQPKRPDFVGFTWVPWLDRFLLVPGEFYNGSSANCPGETPSYADDLPNYPWRKLFTFDVTSRQWAVFSANHGAKYIGNDYPWHSYADPVTQRIIRIESNGDLYADHYDPTTDTWTYFGSNGNNLNCAQSHLAALDRTIYCVDREHGLFGSYHIDTHVVTATALPGDPWCCMSVSKDKGYVFAVPSARKVVYAEMIPATGTFRVWAWSPDSPSWSRIDTLPWTTLDGEALPAGEMPQGTGGAVDTDLGILYLTGQYWGTADYSWAVRLSGGIAPPPLPPVPPSNLTVR